MSEEDTPPIWKGLCAALGAEYRDATEITGASGLTHPLQAIGVDDKGKRAILFSSEYNPRIAALMRGDVQATLPDLRVLVARPLAFDLAHVARRSFFTPDGTLDFQKLSALSAFEVDGETDNEKIFGEAFGGIFKETLDQMARSKLPFKTHVMNVVEQCGDFDWSVAGDLREKGLLQGAIDVLSHLSSFDPLAADRERGICPLPTYEFSENDWELFHSHKDRDELIARLKDLQVFQYFYPPKDLVALGLADRDSGMPQQVERGFEVAEQHGHLLDDNELLPAISDVHELIGELKAKGYIADGEYQIEITEKGKTVRSTLKYRPSEGLISKLSKIVSFKTDISLKFD